MNKFINYLLKLTTFIIAIKSSAAWFEYCDHTVELTRDIYIASPNYPAKYPSQSSCRYHIIAPQDHQIQIDCNIQLDKSDNTCGTEIFYVNNDGDKELHNSEYICAGSGTIQRKSLFNKMTISYTSSGYNVAGAFSCYVKFVQDDSCNCGWSLRQNNRIVGGSEAKISEFSSMAALINSYGKVYCGGSVIGHRYVLTTSHCIDSAYPAQIVVGDHDLTTSFETPYTQYHEVLSVIRHADYNSATNVNDIAMIVTKSDIEWSLGVGPICLPFLYNQNNFVGAKVDLAGWGTTSYGGAASNVLLKTTVSVIDNYECDRIYNDMTSDKLCTNGPNRDSCQFDSGGPVIFKSSKSMQLIGLISYGNSCGINPSVNTKVASYLDWIVRNAIGTRFCRSY